MRFKGMLIGLVWVLLPLSVSAEFYRYIDESGVTHFTDNYIEIPAHLQSSVQKIVDPDDKLSPEERAERDRPQKTVDPKTEAEIKAARRQQQFEILNKSKADLDKTYADLVKEKQVLEKETETQKAPKEFKAYQDRVIRFNQRRADYDKQQKAFQKKADAYNKEIAQ